MSTFEQNVDAVTEYFRNVMPVSFTRNELNRTMKRDKYFGNMPATLHNRVIERLALYAR